MNVIDAFVVTFGINDTAFKKGERDIADATKRTKEQTKKSFDAMELQGKAAGEAFRNVRNEVVGLGLAFLGASSITGLVSNMMTGAASADRLGQTMGMVTGKVWAWRMAMDSMNGRPQDADAALRTVQNDRMDFHFGRNMTKANIYARLGIGKDDFEQGDPGEILKKISGMRDKMDPQEFANLVQQLGLSDSVVSFLMQGRKSVESLISANERNSKGQAELAKKTEEFQRTIAALKTNIIEKLTPAVVKIADFLNGILGGNGDKPDGTMGGDIHAAIKGDWSGIFKIRREGKGQDPANTDFMKGLIGAGSGKGFSSVAHAVANRFGLNPVDVAAQMSYETGGTFNPAKMGGKGGRYMGLIQFSPENRAKYGINAQSSPQQWAAAIIKYLEDRGFRRGMGGLDLYSTINAGRPGRYNASDGYGTVRSHYAKIMREHQGNARRWLGASHPVKIGQINIHTKATDAKGIARDIHGELRRRHAVAQADRGMMG